NAFAIHTATQVNAEILGLSNVIGTVEVGKLADLIVVERNPLVDMSALSTVKMVATRGRIHRNIKIKKNKRIDDLLNSLM
ncbi:MAG: amidohydrolase family protein, partial [Clostridia bacterium]